MKTTYDAIIASSTGLIRAYGESYKLAKKASRPMVVAAFAEGFSALTTDSIRRENERLLIKANMKHMKASGESVATITETVKSAGQKTVATVMKLFKILVKTIEQLIADFSVTAKRAEKAKAGFAKVAELNVEGNAKVEKALNGAGDEIVDANKVAESIKGLFDIAAKGEAINDASIVVVPNVELVAKTMSAADIKAKLGVIVDQLGNVNADLKVFKDLKDEINGKSKDIVKAINGADKSKVPAYRDAFAKVIKEVTKATGAYKVYIGKCITAGASYGKALASLKKSK